VGAFEFKILSYMLMAVYSKVEIAYFKKILGFPILNERYLNLIILLIKKDSEYYDAT